MKRASCTQPGCKRFGFLVIGRTRLCTKHMSNESFIQIALDQQREAKAAREAKKAVRAC